MSKSLIFGIILITIVIVVVIVVYFMMKSHPSLILAKQPLEGRGYSPNLAYSESIPLRPTNAPTPTTTNPPIQKNNYIRSYDGNYLILENSYKISSTPDYTQATPIVLGTLKYNNQEFYPLMTETGKYISMTNNYVNYTDVVGNNSNNETSLVLMSKTYPTDLYLWGTSYSIQPSLVVGTDSNNSFSLVYV